MKNRFFLGLIIAALSFSLGAMEAKLEIDFSNVTAQGLEEFTLAYKMRCYHQLTPHTVTSMENRMKELGITPDDDRFISLISKLLSNKTLTPVQQQTLVKFNNVRLMRGHEEVHLPAYGINGHKIVTVRTHK